MIERIWRFGVAQLDEASAVAPIVAAMLAVEGFGAVAYDLNQRDQWRPLNEEALVVDALTQRTQVVRVRGAEGAMAMVAMGKHGEQATAIIRTPEGEGERVSEARWRERFEAMPLTQAMVTSEKWRQEVAGRGIVEVGEPGLVPMAVAWSRAEVPRAVGALRSEGGVEVVEDEAFVGVVLGAGGTITGEAHAAEVGRALRVIRAS